MRILTKSPFGAKGLISIVEASDNVPQTVVFCIPIDIRDAERMRDIYAFQRYFSDGISTKINDRGITNTIYLDYISPRQTGTEINLRPKFVASIKGQKIDFYLSSLNYLSDNSRQMLNIDYFYSGSYLSDDFFNKRLVIVEPDWRQLDKLFLETRVVFTDWK